MIPSLIIVTKEIILNLKKAESGSEKTNLFLMNMMKQWTGCLSARLLLTSLRREDHVCGQYTFIYSWWGWRYVRKYSGLCVTIYPTTRGEYGMQQWNTILFLRIPSTRGQSVVIIFIKSTLIWRKIYIVANIHHYSYVLGEKYGKNMRICVLQRSVLCNVLVLAHVWSNQFRRGQNNMSYSIRSGGLLCKIYIDSPWFWWQI